MNNRRNKMMPLKIKPFFKTDYIKNDITSGSVNCCETNALNILQLKILNHFLFL